jgi:hypothetical protein
VREYEEQEKAATARAKTAGIDHRAQLDREKLTAEQRLAILRDEQTIATDLLRAEVDAMVRRFEAAQSGFSEALLALSNHDTLVKVADAMSVQSFIGGKTFVEVVDKVFAGTPLEALMTRVKARGLEP